MSKIIHKILFGFIYTVGYFFLALLSTGGGHGNFYLLLPLIPWILLFVAIFLFGKLDDLFMQILFVTVMIVHYSLIIFFASDYQFAEDKGWTQHYFPYTAIIWYIAGQIILWLMFFGELIQRKGKEVD